MTFGEIQNIKQLSDFLRIDLERLNFFLVNEPTILCKTSEPIAEERLKNEVTFNDPIILASGYENFWVEELVIPKKNRNLGNRIVYRIINGTLCNLNKVISSHLNQVYSPLDSVNGFVRERYTKRNAFPHLNKKVILNVDIKNFFESITIEMVLAAFSKLGCIEEMANSLAKLTTLNGRLPQGFFTSPILANMVSEEMDKQLMALASEKKCAYTRYADDICFSSNSIPPAVEDIKSILGKFGFMLNDQKTRYMYKGQKQYVTGLTVSDSEYPRIPRKTKKKIRLLLYYIEKFGVISHLMHVRGLAPKDVDDRSMLSLKAEGEDLIRYFIRGNIDYIKSIEPELAVRFHEKLNLISKNN